MVSEFNGHSCSYFAGLVLMAVTGCGNGSAGQPSTSVQEETIAVDINEVDNGPGHCGVNQVWNDQAWKCVGEPGKMVVVPAGPFWMGCNEEVDNWCSYECPTYGHLCDEFPYHEVWLDTYWIDVTEVTVDEYADCVATADCTVPGCTYPEDQDRSHVIQLPTWGDPSKGNHPVNCVTWYQASAYCAWAGKRLCTEAEWEKAARGVDGRIYPWGNTPDPDCDHATMGLRVWAWKWRPGCGTDATMPVDSHPLGASPYGVMDMLGNVFEWCWDGYDGDYYEYSPAENPQGAALSEYCVLRGMNWGGTDSYAMRVSFRYPAFPGEYDDCYGFRCCKSVEE